MKEIEILARLHDPLDVALEKLDGFLFKGIKQTRDVYYHDPLRTELQWKNGRLDSCCRIREQDGKSYVTYKTNHFNGTQWLYADEYETTVTDADLLKTIFGQLGLQELVTVETKRFVFIAPFYEITVDDVTDLGLYLEVEYKGEADPAQSVVDIKAGVRAFMQGLGLNFAEERSLGKPEMMLVRQQEKA